jgi:hypothetical protein
MKKVALGRVHGIRRYCRCAAERVDGGYVASMTSVAGTYLAWRTLTVSGGLVLMMIPVSVTWRV